MFSTFKKMIHKEDKEEKKPILNLEEKTPEDFKREEFNLPEPEEIKRLPIPRPQPAPSNVTPLQREPAPRRPMEPPPMKPLVENTIEPVRPRVSGDLSEVLRRLEDIERRLIRIEEAVVPREKRYP